VEKPDLNLAVWAKIHTEQCVCTWENVAPNEQEYVLLIATMGTKLSSDQRLTNVAVLRGVE